MTSCREHLCPGVYIQHYSSERFCIPDGTHPMGIEFYEDDQVIEAVDWWGEHKWIVGRTVEPAWEQGILWVWTVNDRGEFMGVNPNSITPLKGSDRK